MKLMKVERESNSMMLTISEAEELIKEIKKAIKETTPSESYEIVFEDCNDAEREFTMYIYNSIYKI